MNRKILFLTGTRADFGKIKPLIKVVDELDEFEYSIFITGMHMLKRYGSTYKEIEKCGFTKIYKFVNQAHGDSMDLILSKTIVGLSKYIKQNKPDLLVIHGDRVEVLAAAIVASFNNILVAHIEGGERSGTIDDSIRHAVTKLSHMHMVSNIDARNRVIQLGENKENIFVIGSPDIDVMKADNLPDIKEVKRCYDINFDNYHIVLFHPVTTEYNRFALYAKNLADALLDTSENYVVIYPNNDFGSKFIINEYKRLMTFNNFKFYPSISFEHFLTLLKNAKSLIGNSSAGIREAPVYGIPSVNIGTRQNLRFKTNGIIDTDYSTENIREALKKIDFVRNDLKPIEFFGIGNSASLFKNIICDTSFWDISAQKVFNDIRNIGA